MKTKRIIALLMVALLSFLLCSCGEKKQESKKTETDDYSLMYPVSEIPNYALKEGATTDEIRQTAINAMHDALSVPWFTKKTIAYHRDINGENVNFVAKTNYEYCGIPYTNGSSSLLHWLQYYNFETGEITGIDETKLNESLGNSCATAVMWGWSAISTTYKGIPSYTMNKSYGAYPVGDYAIPQSLNNYKSYSTDTICEDNGREKMFEAYSKVLPGDGLVSYTKTGKGNHAVMAIEKAHIEYNEEGAINEKTSYIVIQDQRAGHSSNSSTYVITDEDGNKSHYAGRTSAVFYYRDLFDQGYIPVTIPELTGEKPYIPSKVYLDKRDIKSLWELEKATSISNYKTVSLTLTATDTKTGKVVGSAKKITSGNEISTGECYKCKLKTLASNEKLTKKLKKGTEYQFKLDVLIATGETKTPLDITIKYK